MPLQKNLQVALTQARPLLQLICTPARLSVVAQATAIARPISTSTRSRLKFSHSSLLIHQVRLNKRQTPRGNRGSQFGSYGYAHRHHTELDK